MDAIHLIGANEVRSAGVSMRDAATDMNRAASSFENSLYAHRQYMEEWLTRLEITVDKLADAVSGGLKITHAGPDKGGWSSIGLTKVKNEPPT